MHLSYIQQGIHSILVDNIVIMMATYWLTTNGV